MHIQWSQLIKNKNRTYEAYRGKVVVEIERSHGLRVEGRMNLIKTHCMYEISNKIFKH